STVAIGVGAALLLFGDGAVSFLFSAALLPAVAAGILLAAVAFVPHVVSQQVSARALKSHAEYRQWTPGTVITVLSPFLGFLAAVPGGMEMHTVKGERYGHYEPELTVNQVGLIAAIGPLVNIMLGVIFAFLGDAATLPLLGQDLFDVGARINAYIAAFTMLPFYPLNGYKLMRWHTPLWAMVLALAGLLFLL
ncbi:MAG: metalloprotease, partial [Candidatus Nanohaloarchaea archaeon]|nr:metalloprotease [Candidatus Nanohaloarchaea archaeon]